MSTNEIQGLLYKELLVRDNRIAYLEQQLIEARKRGLMSSGAITALVDNEQARGWHKCFNTLTQHMIRFHPRIWHSVFTRMLVEMPPVPQ